jgi:hypothetical protein
MGNGGLYSGLGSCTNSTWFLLKFYLVPTQFLKPMVCLKICPLGQEQQLTSDVPQQKTVYLRRRIVVCDNLFNTGTQ